MMVSDGGKSTKVSPFMSEHNLQRVSKKQDEVYVQHLCSRLWGVYGLKTQPALHPPHAAKSHIIELKH